MTYLWYKTAAPPLYGSGAAVINKYKLTVLMRWR